jgi:hypothetical protein
MPTALVQINSNPVGMNAHPTEAAAESSHFAVTWPYFLRTTTQPIE